MESMYVWCVMPDGKRRCSTPQLIRHKTPRWVLWNSEGRYWFIYEWDAGEELDG